MARVLYSYHECEYSWYEYKYWAVEYEYENKYIAIEYKYSKFVREYEYEYKVLELRNLVYSLVNIIMDYRSLLFIYT